jgi:PAS domain S-box-containing protein
MDMNIMKIDAYTKNKIFGIAVKNILSIAHLFLILIILVSLKDLNFKIIYNRIILSGIVPAFSIISCSFLSILACQLGQYRKELLIFSLICLEFIILDIDIFLNCLVSESSSLLLLSHLSNIGLILLPALIFHHFYILSQKQFLKLTALLTYLAAIIIFPFTLGEYYSPGSHSPFWSLAFIPLSTMGYIYFSKNKKEVMELLNIYVSGGIIIGFLILSTLTIALSRQRDWTIIHYVFIIILFFLFYFLAKSISSRLLKLFFRDQKKELEEAFANLSKDLSLSSSIDMIKDQLTRAIFNFALPLDCTILIQDSKNQVFSGSKQLNPLEKIPAIPARQNDQSNPLIIKETHPLMPLFKADTDLISQQQLEQWIISYDIILDNTEQINNIELIQPIFFEENLVSILLIGPKLSGGLYSKTEQKFFHQLGLSLGSYLKNASLHHTLEQKVISRTEELSRKNIEIINIMEKQKKNHNELSATNRIMNKLIEESPFGIMMVNNDRKIMRVNNAAAKIFGHSKENIIKKKCHEFVCPHKENNCPIFDKGETVNQRETICLNPDRNEVPILKSAIKIEDFILETFIDITEITQARLTIIEARKEAEKANMVKSDFLANMSHEIRTPMNAIIGMTDLTLKKKPSERLAHNLDIIKASADSLLGLINEILDFSKIEAGKLSLENIKFNLRESLEILTDLFGEKCEKKEIELLVDIDNDVPDGLTGDPLRLRQILINLTSNAIKFTPKGDILIKVRNKSLTKDQSIISFSVKDSGIGISQKQITRLFTAFTQADSSHTRKFGGTGLGLAICKRLVEMMGGNINVSSEQGDGSLFEFYANFGRQAEEQKLSFITPESLNNLKTLIVDDNTVVRKIMEKMLMSFGFKAQSADSGLKAIELLSQAVDSDSPFQLVLMDLRMDGMDGLSTILKIRENKTLKNIPIILMSAFLNEVEVNRVEQAGIRYFLAKPIKKTVLFKIIMDVFGCKDKNLTEQSEDEAIKLINGAEILLVEDNTINQRVASEILSSVGLNVIIANNGLEAVEKVKGSAPSKFDAVLMDIQMPEMDGYEASLEIRKDPVFSNLPIIAMTAHAMSGDREKSLSAGMNDHITKPIDNEVLYKTLARWINIENLKQKINETEPNPLSCKNKNISKPQIILPEKIPGIDIRNGLERINNNSKLFINLLHDFAKNYNDYADKIKKYLEQKNPEKVKQLAHTISGLSGTIGAIDLHKSAKKLESSILKSPADIDNIIETFSKSLSTAIESINNLKLKKDKEIERKKTKGSPPPDLTKMKLILDKLAGLINESDAQAEEYLNSIKDELKFEKIQDDLTNLEQSLYNIDFDNALIFLKSITKKTGLKLKEQQNNE